MKRLIVGFALVALEATMLGGMAMADSVVLNSYETTPGNSYQIVFVTYNGILGTSADETTYNTFATSEAQADATLNSLNASWTAITQTPTVAASTNAQVYAGVPIFNTAGQLVATGNGLYSPSAPYTIANPMNYNQYGVQDSYNPSSTTYLLHNNYSESIVYSGFGKGYSNPGYVAMGGGEPVVGNADSTYDTQWLIAGTVGSPGLEAFSVYALSSVIVVPGTSSVPEPSALVAYASLGAMGLVVYGWRKRKLVEGRNNRTIDV